jgi:hypothetical protein
MDLSMRHEVRAELETQIRITWRTKYVMNKILDSQVSPGIHKHLFTWRGYGSAYHSWITAFYII